MATLEEIRNKLKANESKRDATSLDNTVYPVWNIKPDTKAIIRFLPDADPNNTFFWVDRTMIQLPFTGIIGNPSSAPVTVRVPCMEMYGEQDPIIVETRPWWDDPSLKDLAAQYWKKRSYIFQGFVVEDGLKEENPPESPIRRFIVTPQIYKIIKASLMDPDFDSLPTDYVDGVDFKVVKTKKGSYADYSTSEWSRRSRPLSDAELDAIDTHGLFNLADFLPKKPSDIEQKVIKEMFEASVNGEKFDPARWGQYYKPNGVDIPESSDSSSSTTTRTATRSATPAAPTPATVAPKVTPRVSVVKDDQDDEDEDAPWANESKAPSAPVSKAEDIIAMIRNRKPA